MSEVRDLAEARFEKHDRARDTSVADMLRTMLARVERGEIKAEHVVLVYALKGDNDCLYTALAQAGPYNSYGVQGLLNSAINLVDRA